MKALNIKKRKRLPQGQPRWARWFTAYKPPSNCYISILKSKKLKRLDLPPTPRHLE